jgi:hypothetical protein
MPTAIQLGSAGAGDGAVTVADPTSRNGWPICVITDENAGDAVVVANLHGSALPIVTSSEKGSRNLIDALNHSQ